MNTRKTIHLLAILIFTLGLFIPPTMSARAANLVVNSADDTIANDGFCTLREAITNANADDQSGSTDCAAGSGADAITFAADYTITLVGSQLPTIDSNVTITGNGAANTIIQANANPNVATYRVLEIGATGNLTLDGVTVRNGKESDGGGIYNWGTATITASTISGNRTDGDNGGGICNQGIATITITDSTISDNTAGGSGGGIYNAGTATINASTISGNTANYGGGIYNNYGTATITITASTISGNTANYDGGGISNYGTATISASTISGNTANYGGGIHNYYGTTTITASTISGNTANYSGGGIYNYGTATITITASTLSSNTATYGGGIYNGASLSVANSTLSGNTADSGGGISNGASLSVTNSTLAGNSATSAGGGAIESGNSGMTTLTNVTISGNASASVAAVWNEEGTLHLTNTIIANSTGADCQNDDILGTNVNNLVEDNTCSPALSGDPKLAPLANNGGDTQTLALLAGSPAIDAGTNVGCPATDQRGVARPQHITCDIGAYEKMDASGFPTFADVPTNAFGWAYIESIYAAGITGGCSSGPLNYCPNGFVTRAQMAIFLLRGIHGSAYSPPPATGTLFTDVPLNAFAAAWIEQFSTEGITGGCGGGNYCPNESVTRAQMAVFLLRAKHGAAYTPPAASGDFADVGVAGFAAWIEQLAAEGITGGCGGGNYCPNEPVTRAQMAVFIQRTFNLPLP